MPELNSKMKSALEHWDYNKLLQTKQERKTWLESEAAYIKGLIFRASQICLSADIKILQIGAGPCDVIDHWGQGQKFAIDPLAEEYKKRFSEFMDPEVSYISGIGEELPFENNFFDVVIVRNALDHVIDPHKTLQEIFRVLKPTGSLYIWIYLYSWRASLVYRAINALTKRYEVEPWAFTYGRIMKILRQNSFIPVLPAVEERPNIFHKPGSISESIKQCVRKILNFTCRYAYTCVALPQKGVHKEWKLVGT